MRTIKLKEKTVVGWLGDTYKETYINLIDIFIDVFKQMSKEQKQLLLQELAMDKDVGDTFLKRIVGEDSGWESEKDNNYRLELLNKIEDYSIKTLDWKILSKLIKSVEEKIKIAKSNNELYWKMYHDPIHSEFFEKWFKENNVKNQYEIELDEAQKLKEFVESEIKKFFNSKKILN